MIPDIKESVLCFKGPHHNALVVINRLLLDDYVEVKVIKTCSKPLFCFIIPFLILLGDSTFSAGRDQLLQAFQ
jgi:hypothetical protein